MLNKRFLVFAILFLFLLPFTAESANIFAPPIPARIGGSVAVDGTPLTQATDDGYTFKVTKQDGTAYVDLNGVPAQDLDGLNSFDWYLIDIPIYDAADQPGGAVPGETAIIHVYKGGQELTVTSPSNAIILVGSSGSTTRIDIETEADSKISKIAPILQLLLLDNVDNDGLVAYYPFNGNANDQSDNDLNGTVSGAILTTDRLGNPNSAYSFDGINDKILVPDNPLLHFGNGPFTISFWMKTSSSDYNYIIDKDVSGTPSGLYRFLLSNTGRCAFQIQDAGHCCSADEAYSSAVVNDDQWHHVVGVRNSDSLLIYVDGELSGMDNDLFIGNTDNNAPLAFGGASLANNIWYAGALDEIRIYDKALTEFEILELFEKGALSDPMHSSATGHWYQFNYARMTWADAKAFAESQGGYLATITSAAENKWISDNFTIQSGILPFFGGNDIPSEGQWEWITGEAWSYTNWYSGEPNNMYPEDCIRFHPYYRSGHGNYWNDVRCDSEQFSLIEYDVNPN